MFSLSPFIDAMKHHPPLSMPITIDPHSLHTFWFFFWRERDHSHGTSLLVKIYFHSSTSHVIPLTIICCRLIMYHRLPSPQIHMSFETIISLQNCIWQCCYINKLKQSNFNKFIVDVIEDMFSQLIKWVHPLSHSHFNLVLSYLEAYQYKCP